MNEELNCMLSQRVRKRNNEKELDNDLTGLTNLCHRVTVRSSRTMGHRTSIEY